MKLRHTSPIKSSIVDPRDVMKALILANCTSIIVGHNHPSDDTSSSPKDIEVMKRLVEAGHILGFDVIDHLILESNTFRSLKESGST